MTTTSPKKKGSDPLTLGDQLAIRLREAVTIVVLAVAAYLLLALVTYHPADPGWSYAAGSPQTLHNSSGRMGAWIADVLLSLFGWLSYLLPLLMAQFGIQLFQQRLGGIGFHPLMTMLRIAGLLSVLMSGTTLLVIHLPQQELLPFGNGGLLGQAVSEEAVPVLGVPGCTLLLLAIFLVAFTLISNLSWFHLAMQSFKLVRDFGVFVAYGCSVLASTLRARYVTWKLSRPVADYKQTEVKVIERPKPQPKARQRKEPVVADTAPIIAPPPPPSPVSKRALEENQGQLFDGEVIDPLPAVNLLDDAKHSEAPGFSKESLEGMSRILEAKLKDFGVDAEVVAVLPGPVITRFEIQPAAGVKVSKISNLAKDLARSLAVISVRVVEVIPGKSVVGIEIPNENRQTVFFSEVVSSARFDESKSPLSLALGHDISGLPMVVDLAKMPHLLVAGTTGSGKSVGVNSMLLSMLFKSSPEEVRLIMIDPKMLELSVYEGIPHLLAPVVTDMKEAANALRWCVAEMERRYKLMAALGVRNIGGFNKKVRDAQKAGQPITDPLFKVGEDGAEAPLLEPLPFIVVVIDEFADMMMIVGKKVEELIARIAQKARAAGIHLILATQRPSVDVITGLIKANIPTRIGFQVSSKIDSRTILDQGGAEQLLGLGDMLYLPPGTSVPIRVHGAFVSDDEVHRVVADWKKRGAPAYDDAILNGIEADAEPSAFSAGLDDNEQDALYDEAVAFVTESRRASISAVQRKLKIGYNRAANMIEAMEQAGVISPPGHNGNREVLAPPPPKA
ncbi:DNA translocase FtsK [Endozoicomonadaceae bacterium StTr2]